MSAETDLWLNTRTLIGFTEKRGTAWHYRSDLQAEESNHYPGAIPVDDVLRRLFDFTVEETPLYVRGHGGYVEIPDRKAMVTSDTGDVLGIFKGGYQGHGYEPWLLDNISNLLDDTLGIGSAGLLRNRAQAWVSVEVPDTIGTPEGVEFRPNITACSSYDGSLATTYKRHIGVIVCDNTLGGALGEAGQAYKLKHTRYSNMKLIDAREALAIVHTMADDFAAEVKALTAWKVSDRQFATLLDVIVPVPENEGRGKTVAEKKQAEIINLYRHDDRAAPWTNTAYGVMAAFSTWNHHYATVRGGVPRLMRNMENAIGGKLMAADVAVMEALAAIA